MLRSFDTQLTISDEGREVIGRIFPLGQVAHIREIGENGAMEEYDEEFLPNCTQRIRQIATKRGGAPAWIRLTLDHSRAEDARIGFCTSLIEADGGVDATFKLLNNDEGRLAKFRSMLAESHTGFSVEFTDHAPPKITGNLRQRVMINLFAVSATPIPTYPSARVFAVRADEDPLLEVGTPNLDKVRAMLSAS